MPESSMLTSLTRLRDMLWGPALMALLVGTGAYLTVGLRGITFRRLGHATRLLLGGRKAKPGQQGSITPFQALTTALSSTVGTGNIAGVATAIFLGGPGAVFWMWITALVGMASKFCETVLAIRFRRLGRDGSVSGGPMYYIESGLGPSWKWLAAAFAAFGSAAAFGIGNMVQSNSVAQAVKASAGIPVAVTGGTLSAITGLVILGGITRIGRVTEILVPFMTVLYSAGTAWLIVRSWRDIPAAFSLILKGAFTPTAPVAGFTGSTVMATIRTGVSRGVFSNEDGLGSAAIGHAAARTSEPAAQGLVAMLGSVIDTLIMCTMTALAVILTGAWSSGLTGAEMTAAAFRKGLPGPGDFVVSFSLVTFALATIFGWAYYGEQCIRYLLGVRAVSFYRLAWTVAVAVGAIVELPLVWTFSDMMNALMAWPNLFGLLALRSIAFREARRYEAKRFLR